MGVGGPDTRPAARHQSRPTGSPRGIESLKAPAAAHLQPQRAAQGLDQRVTFSGPRRSPSGPLRGLVTDRDLVVRVLAEGRNVDEATVSQACSADLVAVSPDDDIDRAVQLMREQAVRRLPVVENERPVGIVSLGDLAIERDPSSALGDISSAEPNQ
ncbi:CBS domain-containing protein [Streptomyces sp. NPDC019443]|uniref:CBS domain-containing protein n=1 Tax=Streptomyces sp. NPDC019443 TaxID=3365061 RepID=UPI0037B1CBCB